MSIRFRLTLWYTAILALTLLVFGVILFFIFSTMINNQNENMLEEHATKVHQRIDFEVSLSFSGWDIDIQLDDVDTVLSNEVYFQIANLTNLSSVKISRSSNAVINRIQFPITEQTLERAHLEREGFFEKIVIQGYPFLIYHKPIFTTDGTKIMGILQAAIITGEIVSDLQTIFIISSIITIFLASSLGWFLARKALRPIDHVITATEKIENGNDLDNRIEYEGPNDEIGRLTVKINGMLSRIQTTYLELEGAYSAQRRFVSDASHELRTPLTTIRGNVELIQKMWSQSSSHEQFSEQVLSEMSMEAIRDIADEAELMSRLVNDLLSLARADAGYEMKLERVMIKSLIEDIIRKAQFIPKFAEWRIGDISALDGLAVKGSKDYLQQMFFIFIENAFKYTNQGYVQLDAQTMGGQLGIHITDTGVGMDKEEVPHIFERFYRADLSRGRASGTGLGLSIAKWIIDEHRGSVEVVTHKDQGTRFTIWLPIDFPALEK